MTETIDDRFQELAHKIWLDADGWHEVWLDADGWHHELKAKLVAEGQERHD